MSTHRQHLLRTACGLTVGTIAFAMSAAFPVSASDAPAFYNGRNVSVTVGFSAGGTYNLYARVLAKHMGRHIPGNPTLIVQNMPGAGSLKAANFLYSVAPKDGSVFGTIARGLVIAPLMGTADYDSRKFTWLGSITDDANVCLSWHTSKVKTWNDLLTKPFIAAGQGTNADPNIYANLVKNVFHAPIQLISGYPGTSEIGLAMERSEVDGVCAISYSTVKATYAPMLERKQINILFQAALTKAADLPDVPLLIDQAPDNEARQVLKLILGVQGMARPFVAPPGIPEDRKNVLRTAFNETMKDSAFLAEAKKLDLEVNPSDGAELDKLVADLYSTPDAAVKKAASAISK